MPSMRPLPIALALVVAGAAACEYRPLPHEIDPIDQVRPDAAVIGTSPGSPARPGPGACDPVAQSCGGSQRCAADCTRLTYVCGPRHREALGSQGSVCSHDEDCQAGYVCLERSGRLSGARCLRYCRGTQDCSDGSNCVAVALACNEGPVPRFLERRLCVYR